MSFDMNVWVNRLIEHEGIKLMPYKCPLGKLTIGVGRNLEDNPLSGEEKRALGDYMHGITVNGAKMLLRNDIMSAYKGCKKLFKEFESLDVERQYALVDMCFQLGVKGLSKFRLMRWAIADKDFEGASKACLSSCYAKQTPKRARRIAEVIRTGGWK